MRGHSCHLLSAISFGGWKRPNLFDSDQDSYASVHQGEYLKQTLSPKLRKTLHFVAFAPAFCCFDQAILLMACRFSILVGAGR